MNEYFFIFNPLSFESQKDPNLFEKIKKELEKNEIVADLHRTFQVGDVGNLIKHAISEDIKYKKIIIIGGDETISEAVQKFAQMNLNEISLGIIPTGRDNFLFNSFNSQNSNWKKAIWNLQNLNSKPISLSISGNQAFLKRFVAEKNFDAMLENEKKETKIIFDQKFQLITPVRKIVVESLENKFFVQVSSCTLQNFENKDAKLDLSRFFCKSLSIFAPQSFLKFADSALNNELSKQTEIQILKTSISLNFLR
ncbi:MAG: hypothetical protein Fur0024_4060 [Patescibacteria group bacterium]